MIVKRRDPFPRQRLVYTANGDLLLVTYRKPSHRRVRKELLLRHPSNDRKWGNLMFLDIYSQDFSLDIKATKATIKTIMTSNNQMQFILNKKALWICDLWVKRPIKKNDVYGSNGYSACIKPTLHWQTTCQTSLVWLLKITRIRSIWTSFYCHGLTSSFKTYHIPS